MVRRGSRRRKNKTLREALALVGVDAEDVSFESVYRYEPSSVSVDVDEVEERGEAIVDAVEEAIGRAGQYGVSFGLTEESCVPATALARREAIPIAEAAADDLSLALNLQRGEVASVTEYPLSHPFYSGPHSDTSSCNEMSDYGVGILLPFHTEPEVEVSVGLQVSYRLC